MGDPLGRHALIIEDEMLIAELGFESFDIADSPSEALRCAEDRRPDLITADIRIIGGTGIEAVDAITAALGPIPVVYVTGNPDLVARRQTVTVVDKPIVPRVLAAACARACGILA
jgi:CheY-like chemotaxis protein